MKLSSIGCYLPVNIPRIFYLTNRIKIEVVYKVMETNANIDSKGYHLERYLSAQKGVYQTALNELRAGRKQSHWMWYIFPQIKGLGFTEISRHYAIKDLGEAREYLSHRVLGPRLILACNTLLELDTNNAHQIFGSPDDLKLKSSMTLFLAVSNADPVFEKVLQKFYNGLRDHVTLKILKLQNI
jgi:uncharacterized protein (DUF1810 family)